MKKENLEKKEELEKLNSAIINLGKQLHAVTPDFYNFDLLLITALNRTINVNKAFLDLKKSNNFIAAAPLVRINLDTLLRIYAGRISNLEINEFAKKIIFEGKKINNLKSTEKDEKGKLKNLSDNYLKKSLSKREGFEWVEKIYDIGNSYIHLDSRIFFDSNKIVSKKEKKVALTIGHHDSFISKDEKDGALYWMEKITYGIIEHAKIWIAEKAKAYKFDIMKLNNLENFN